MVTCSGCGAERQSKPRKAGGERVPKGWSEWNGQTLCGKCMSARTVVRAVTLPVAGPVEITWPELRERLRVAWGESTSAANWIVTELYARDYRRSEGDDRLPKMGPTYLYPEVRALFPGIPSTCVPTMEQDITATYRSRRYELLWTRSRSLDTYRYPYPYPIPGAGWSVAEEDGAWVVSLPLPGGRTRLRLRGGHQFARQDAQLRAILAGEAKQAAAAIYRVTSRTGDHRPDVQQSRVMVKLVARFARAASVESTRVLHVRTDPDAFLVAGDWRLNADHVLGWICTAQRKRGRMLEDLKCERRSPRARRRGMVETMGARAERDRARLASWSHEAASMVVGYAQRTRCGAVRWEDTGERRPREYPWHDFVLKLEAKVRAAGMEWEVASGADVSGDVGVLADV